ncbi:hypothetical protein QNN98_08890 [Arthrobacter sp. zg-Y1143]|nr:hypothetical protein [Arthrobacter sp. zg-Y1143]
MRSTAAAAFSMRTDGGTAPGARCFAFRYSAAGPHRTAADS